MTKDNREDETASAPVEPLLEALGAETQWRESMGVRADLGDAQSALSVDLETPVEGLDAKDFGGDVAVGASAMMQARGGEDDTPPPTCGPDVSDWFCRELQRHRANLEQVRANFAPAAWILWVWKHGMSIQYKSMAFKTENCPTGCEHSVWLCGHCIDRSELGNVILGFWVGYLGFSARVLAAGVNAIGSKKPGEGADNPTDTAGIGLGFAMAHKLRYTRGARDVPDELKDEASFCAFFNAGLPWQRKELDPYFKEMFVNGQIWADGWSEPFKHLSKGLENCAQCPDRWAGPPHPLPSALPADQE